MARSLQLAVTVACLALLWQLADGERALRYLAAANPLWMAAALAALTLQTVFSALRWRLTAQRLGIVLDRREALGEYYLSQLVNQLLPGGVLGDAGRAIRARAQAGLLASGQAVLFERLAGQIALFLVFAAGLAGTLTVPGGFEVPPLLLPPLALALLTAPGLWLLWERAPSDPRPGHVSPFPARALPAAAAFVGAFLRAVASPGVRGRQFALSLGTALCNIAAFACCAAAVGLMLAPPAAQVLVPLILFSMLIPVTLSGWGLREGTAAALLPLAGATGPEALAASVAFGLAFLVASLPGLLSLALAAAPDALEP